MVFVFDIDDTICDTDGYSEWYIKNFIIQHKLPYRQIAKNVRFAEYKFDWTNEQALDWYKNYGDKMALHFPVKGNSVEIINQLFDAGHTIVIATARSTDWHVEPYDITLKWFEKVGLKFSKIYIGRTDKDAVCKEVNADVFVDDDLKTILRVDEMFNKIGKGKVFLAQTNYNKTLEIPKNIEIIKDFDEMIDNLDVSITNGSYGVCIKEKGLFKGLAIILDSKTKKHFTSNIAVYRYNSEFANELGDNITAVYGYVSRCAFNVFNVYEKLCKTDKTNCKNELREFKKDLLQRNAFGNTALKMRCYGKIFWFIYKILDKTVGKLLKGTK